MGENGSSGMVKVRVITQKVEFHIFEHEKVHFGFIFSHNDDEYSHRMIDSCCTICIGNKFILSAESGPSCC